MLSTVPKSPRDTQHDRTGPPDQRAQSRDGTRALPRVSGKLLQSPIISPGGDTIRGGDSSSLAQEKSKSLLHSREASPGERQPRSHTVAVPAHERTRSQDSTRSVNSMSGKAFINTITHNANELDKCGRVVSGDIPVDFVLCVDGTGNDMPNEPREKNTNVTRIVDLLIPGKQKKKNKERKITVAYLKGIGNDGIEQMNMNRKRNTRSLKDLHHMFRSLESIPSPTTETPTPSQFTENAATQSLIIEMVAINYTYISTHIRPDRKDRLFIFGCGLGASVSQLTTALVADWGIFDTEKYLEKYGDDDYPPIIKTIVDTWVKRKGKKINPQGPFNKPPKYFDCFTEIKVEFLGLLDRVNSIKKPDSSPEGFKVVKATGKKLEFATGIQNRPAIVKARGAFALSEYELEPVTWNIDDVEQAERVLELGFPGYNASICGGGGAKHRGIIIDLMLDVWMLAECSKLHYAIDERELQKLIETELNLPLVKVLRKKKESGDPTRLPGSENEDQESQGTKSEGQENEGTEHSHWDEEIGMSIIDGPPLPKGTGKHLGEPIPERGPAAPKGTGHHYRTEFGKYATQKLHRVCEQGMWDVFCPHKMPVLGRAKNGEPCFVWTMKRKWMYTHPLLEDLAKSKAEDEKISRKIGSRQESKMTKRLEQRTFGLITSFEMDFINLILENLKKKGTVEWSPPRTLGRESAEILVRSTKGNDGAGQQGK